MSEQQQQPIISLRDVNKVYTMASGNFLALKGISLDIGEGEFLGIIGKSGAGKTTLLNMISGVSEITQGEVTFNSHGGNGKREGDRVYTIHEMDEDEMALWRGENIGIVYQLIGTTSTKSTQLLTDSIGLSLNIGVDFSL